MSTAVVDARSASEVRAAIVATLKAERSLLAEADLRPAASDLLRLIVRALAVAKRNPSAVHSLDRNGVTALEALLQRGISEVLMRALWPSVVKGYALGEGKRAALPASVAHLDLDGMIELYDSVSPRLAREPIQNAAWRISSRVVDVARRLSNAR